MAVENRPGGGSGPACGYSPAFIPFPFMARPLHHKVLLVSGGSSGIGAATVLAAAEAGMHVSFCGRQLKPLERVIVEVARRNVRVKVHYFCGDVTSGADMQAWVSEVMVHFGRIDAVFCNAGFGTMSPALATAPRDVRAMFDTNYHGTVNLYEAAYRAMRESPDGLRHILFCASAAAKIGMPFYAHYAATKAAQDALAAGLASELHDEGFRVSVVYPTGTRTNFFNVAGARGVSNTPPWMEQDADAVARSVIKCLASPKAAVWPSASTRWLVKLGQLCPAITAGQLLKMARRKMRG